MAITFLQRKKFQRILALMLLGVLFLTAFVLWKGFFQASPQPVLSPAPPKQIEVNTQVLDSPVFEELREPGAKVEIPADVGRDNPFLP